MHCNYSIGMSNQNGQQGWSSPSHGGWQSSNMGQTGPNMGMHQMPTMSPGGSWSNSGTYMKQKINCFT